MLISVYENNNAVNFSSKLDTTITIPKNATIKLMKAYIPRNHIIEIDGTNDQLGINLHNKRQSDSKLVNLTQGLYGVDAFMEHLESRLNATVGAKGTEQNSDFRFQCDYQKSAGVGEDAISIRIIGNSIYADFWVSMFMERASGSDDWADDFVKEEPLLTTYTIVNSGQTFRLSEFKLTADNTPQTTWDNHWGLNKVLTRNWFGKNNVYDPANDRSFPVVPFNWSGFKFTLNDGFDVVGKDYSFWMGITKDVSTIDTTGCTDDDLSTFGNALGIEACAVFYGKSQDGETKGTVEFFENLNGTFTNMGATEVGEVVKGDEFAFCLPENDGEDNNIKYKYKDNNGDGQWKELDLGNNPARPKPNKDENFFMCGGFFEATGTDFAFSELFFGGNPNMAFVDDGNNTGSGFFSHYGKAGTIWIGGARTNNKNLNETIGQDATTLKLEAENNGGSVLDKTYFNPDALVHYDGLANQPYLNLNIKNLPINSIGCDSTDSATRDGRNTMHSSTKTIACLPRYNTNGDGDFDNIVVQCDAQNEQTIELRNKEEMILNSLDFNLRNGDGSIPTDLTTPIGLVLQVKGDELN